MAEGTTQTTAPLPAVIDFSQRLLAWYETHGRKDLPWQQEATPYRVWVSEIMLQQTQVSTVIPYFQRFTARFPTVEALAQAPLDEVLHHWSGLGYYARARNLHRAAQVICEHHGGVFPTDMNSLQALPGIGRSTAGAILALATDTPQPILDGNVKRILTRYHAVEGWPGQPAVERRLWALAAAYVPTTGAARYTQAIMDLGATVCTRRNPACGLCPIADGCVARAAGQAEAFPYPKPRKRLPVRTTIMVMVRDTQGRVLLRRRPPTGIWGGLWSFPEVSAQADIATACQRELGLDVALTARWPQRRHTFTHFHLDIQPVEVRVIGGTGVMAGTETVWYNPADPPGLGLAAPVKWLVHQLEGPHG